jgi:DNA-binding response OmpR family regulator
LPRDGWAASAGGIAVLAAHSGGTTGETEGRGRAMPQSFVVHTVLLIDDAPLLGDVYATALEHAGFEVTRARSAEEAMAALEARRFSAVVSDVRLPGMSGVRLYEWARERFPGATEHWGCCTGWDDPQVRELIVRRGRPLLRKPCRLDALEAFVQGLVPGPQPPVRA